MSWKGTLAVGLLGGYAITALVGVPETRRMIPRALVDRGLEQWAKEHPQFRIPTEEERTNLAKPDVVSIDRTIPVFPGLIVVMHSSNSGGCGNSGLSLVLWYPKHLKVLHDA
jgi:hypothetical protein